MVIEQRRWLTRFAAMLGALLLVALALYLKLPAFRDPPLDFTAMQPGQFFNVHGLTRRQAGSVKLGFAEGYPGPEIGAYGNHVIRFFGADAFGRPEDAAYFFNYFYANLSLPELHGYLRQVERKGHLPRKLMLVQITTPNNDNGDFIIDWGNELPPDILLKGAPPGNIAQLVAVGWRLLRNELHEVLSYNTFILGLVQGGPGDRVVSPAACRGETPAWFRRLPQSIRNVAGGLAGSSFYCQRSTWWDAYRRDGSVDAEFRDPPDRPVAPPTQNQNPLRDADRHLNAGDEHQIASHMRAIDAIGRRNGIKTVFLVPAVYETDRSNSIVNQVFNRALALVPDLTVIDHRAMRGDPALFESYNHNNPAYYRLLAGELRSRGLLD